MTSGSSWQYRVWLAVALCLAVANIRVHAQENAVEELVDAAILRPADTSTSSKPIWSTLGSDGSTAEEQKSLLMSLMIIVVSELGDKTFFIAAIMAMKHSRFVVFCAAFSSLALMSALSAFLGHIVPNLIPKQYTDALAALLFIGFGIRMLYEARHMSEENEEMAEVEEELKEVEDRDRTKHLDSLEVGGVPSVEKPANTATQAKEGFMNLMQLVFSPVFVQTFVLTFLGEWGDRSQISTIALAAANDVYWVTAGVILGHGMCTAIAVVGGRMLAAKISVRTVTLVGAVLFLIFGVFYGVNVYRWHQ